jgi:hypothetical protein
MIQGGLGYNKGGSPDEGNYYEGDVALPMSALQWSTSPDNFPLIISQEPAKGTSTLLIPFLFLS